MKKETNTTTKRAKIEAALQSEDSVSYDLLALENNCSVSYVKSIERRLMNDKPPLTTTKGELLQDNSLKLLPQTVTDEKMLSNDCNRNHFSIGNDDTDEIDIWYTIGQNKDDAKANAELICQAVNERQAILDSNRELLDDNKRLNEENVKLQNKLLFTGKLLELNEFAAKEVDIVARVVVKYYYVKYMGFSGAAFLKDAARYIDSRNESLNDGKSWFTLIGEYAKKVDFDKTTNF